MSNKYYLLTYLLTYTSVLLPRLRTGLGNAAWCTATAGDRSLGVSSVASPCVSRIDFAVNY